MPNMMSPDKRYLSMRVYRKLYYLLTQEAEARGQNRSDYAQEILSREMETKKIKLKKEYQKIVDAEIAAEKKKRKGK